MKFLTSTILGVFLSVSLGAVLPSAADAATCLQANQIAGSDSPDGKVLILRMRDGKRWQGVLKGACSQIRFEGFSWDVSSGQVCENAQAIHVPRMGGACVLGKLSPLPPEKSTRR